MDKMCCTLCGAKLTKRSGVKVKGRWMCKSPVACDDRRNPSRRYELMARQG
jgi:hypothetical protein